MKHLLFPLHLWLMSAVCAYAQNAPEAAPTTFTEPASAFGVIVFLVLFFGSIAAFGFWIWFRGRKSKHH